MVLRLHRRKIIWSGTKKSSGTASPKTIIFTVKNNRNDKEMKKKRVHWISEAFTLIIFKKAYRKYFQNQQALQNIVQHLVHKEQISTQATCQIMFSNLFLVYPFISGRSTII